MSVDTDDGPDNLDDEVAAWATAESTPNPTNAQDATIARVDEGCCSIAPRTEEQIAQAPVEEKKCAPRASSQSTSDARHSSSSDPPHREQPATPFYANHSEATQRWAGRAPPPHLSRIATGSRARYGSKVTRRVKTIDDVVVAEDPLDKGVEEKEPGLELVVGKRKKQSVLSPCMVSLLDESGWDDPPAESQSTPLNSYSRKVAFQTDTAEEVKCESNNPEELSPLLLELCNDWGEPPYEIPTPPDQGKIIRLGDHWLEVEPPMGCRSWQIYFRRNPTHEDLHLPEDDPESEDDGYKWGEEPQQTSYQPSSLFTSRQSLSTSRVSSAQQTSSSARFSASNSNTIDMPFNRWGQKPRKPRLPPESFSEGREGPLSNIYEECHEGKSASDTATAKISLELDVEGQEDNLSGWDDPIETDTTLGQTNEVRCSPLPYRPPEPSGEVAESRFTRSSRDTGALKQRPSGLHQGIRAPRIPPADDQILFKNFKGRGASGSQPAPSADVIGLESLVQRLSVQREKLEAALDVG